jgi:hypothetical protein
MNMSFKCQNCGVPQEPGTKPHKIVTEIRKVIYPPVRDRDGSIKYVPEGFENVCELSICPQCFRLYDFSCNIVGNKMINERIEY